MPITHKKKYGLYHWDTFDNTTFLVDQDDSFDEIVKKAREKYGQHFSFDGADKVEIVDEEGNIVKAFRIK